MRSVANRYDDRVLIGEIYLPVERVMQYYGEQLDEIHLPFNFQLVTTSIWEASTIRQIVDTYEAALPSGAWPNWVLGNHDKPRIANRVGREQARAAQMLLLTLRGTPTCYYGDELAMLNVPVPQELIHDPPGKVNPQYSRDPERSPMQWDGSAHAGFCAAEATPWLPIADDYKIYNVAEEQHDPRSFLMLTRRLLELRRAIPALTLGSYQSIEQENEHCFVFVRQYEDQRYMVALNFSNQDQVLTVVGHTEGNIVLSTSLDREGLIDLSKVHLRSNEGIFISLEEL